MGRVQLECGKPREPQGDVQKGKGERETWNF